MVPNLSTKALPNPSSSVKGSPNFSHASTADGMFSANNCHGSNDNPITSRDDVYAAKFSDETLQAVFTRLDQEDVGIPAEAIAAYEEMKNIPFDDLDKDPIDEDAGASETAGLVQRRAPLNPLRSPWMGRFRKAEHREKVRDPALEKVPLRGRLLFTFMSTAALILIFLQELIVNLEYTGSVYAPRGVNGMIGPEPITLYRLGGLNANQIRKGEIFRIFWAMWLHSGWLHLLFNALSQMQFLWMLEPDWGFTRSVFIYFIAGVSGGSGAFNFLLKIIVSYLSFSVLLGNLVSGTLDPCSTTVGSSGALFGLTAAMVPYCIEYWRSIPRPGLIAIFSVVVLGISLLTGFTGTTDNWAHIGGMFGGLFFGFATTTSLTAFEQISWCRGVKAPSATPSPASTGIGETNDRQKLFKAGGRADSTTVSLRRPKMVRMLERKLRPKYRCGVREWVVRVCGGVLLIAMWALLFQLLLVHYHFQPPGHITFSRVRSCCCCYHKDDTDSVQRWTCNYCDAPLSQKQIWQDVCAVSTRSLAATDWELLT